MGLTDIAFIYIYLPIFAVCLFFLKGIAREIFLIGVSAVFIFMTDAIAFRMLIIPLFDVVCLSLMEAIPTKDKTYGMWVKFLMAKSIAAVPFYCLFADFETPIGVCLLLFDIYALSAWNRKLGLKQAMDFILYVLFFPKLFAGPFLSFKSFRQKLSESSFSSVQCARGIMFFTWGLAKQIIIVAQLTGLISNIYHHYLISPSAAFAWLLAVLTGMKIYFIMSSFGDMARGISFMCMIDVPKTTYYPLHSPSVRDFVYRFNLTLEDAVGTVIFGKFDREVQKKKTYLTSAVSVAIIAVILNGYGVGILWVIYMTAALVLDYFTISKISIKHSVISRLITFVIVTPSFAFLFTSSAADAWGIISGMMFLNGIPLIQDTMMYFSVSNLVIILTSVCLCFRIFETGGRFSKKISSSLWWIFAVAICISVLIITTSFILM